MGSKGKPENLIVKGKRLDNRKLDELRDIEIETGVVPNASGSCRLRIGKTEVLVSVYGPRELLPKHLRIKDKARLMCYYDMASFSTKDRNRPGPSRRSREISMLMENALAPCVMLHKYPETTIDVYAMVLNADAGTRCAAISAAAVALADAGIEMRDLISAVAAGKADGKIVLDLSNPEDNFGEADLPVAILPRTDEITLLQMDGDFSDVELKDALKLAINGCKELYKMQVAALKRRYAEK